MCKTNDQSNSKYAYLYQLSINELLALLDVAPIPATTPEKEAYIDALKEAIIEKENENPTGFFPDVNQQWEQFVTHYLPDLEDTAFESERTEHTGFAQTSQHPLKVPSKRVVRFSRIWRTALVAAATIACMLAFMVTAQATGVDVFGAMARWTKDVFSFGQIPSDSMVSENLGGETKGSEIPAQGFSSLQDALDAYGVTEVSEPRWLPDGYVLDEVDVTYLEDPFYMFFYANYLNGNNYIGIDIVSYEGEPTMQVQKTDSTIKTIEKDGITFYLIENDVGHTIAWCTEQYECYISGESDKDILWGIAISMFNRKEDMT